MIKKSSRRMSGLAVAVSLALMACGSDPLGPDPRDVEFAASLGIDLDNMMETASGLFIRDDSIGSGELAAAGDTATVAYTLWLADGTEIASGVFGVSSPFILGSGGAIAGFDEGVTGMRVGGGRTIVIPANLGYGSGGSGDAIPGDAVLVYELGLTALGKASP